MTTNSTDTAGQIMPIPRKSSRMNLRLKRIEVLTWDSGAVLRKVHLGSEADIHVPV